MPPLPPPQSPSFLRRKAVILAQLSVPAGRYGDLSPKGSVDEGIRGLIDGINARDGWVTTSSCAGRVSVFVEGERAGRGATSGGAGGEGGEKGERKDDSGRSEGKETEGEDVEAEDVEAEDVEAEDVEAEGVEGEQGGEERGRYVGDEEKSSEGGRERTGIGKVTFAGAGGKGGGGRWLFVSHERVDMEGMREKGFSSSLGMQRMGEVEESRRQFTEERLIHFKFEPMILHVLTASLSHAQAILRAALQAGFRESGALNLISANSEALTPMVAVRSTGLALDSVIGRLSTDGEGISLVSESYLEGLLSIGNERFAENSRRIARFQDLLLGSATIPFDMEKGTKTRNREWEDASTRRERKRAEGLKRSQELRDLAEP